MYKFKLLIILFIGTLLSSCNNNLLQTSSNTTSKICTYPPFLKEGDKVAIISPAGKDDMGQFEGAIKRLKEWHLVPYIERYATGSYGDYSGTVEERAEDLQHAMDDKDVKAILCSRGGYGVVQIIHKLNFKQFRKYPKWIIGYSDITALHNVIQTQKVASLHSPMAEQMADLPDSDKSNTYLKNILFGTLPEYHIDASPYDHYGKASGVIRGGNLSVLYGLRGTSYDIPAKGTILFIEDIGERYYVIERMLYDLKLGGVLDHLSGLIIGQFNKLDKTEWMNNKDTYQSIANLLSEYHYPICFGFPVGHVTDNYPLIEGSKVEITVDKNGTQLRFSK